MQIENIIDAAKSAMTTLLITEQKPFDFSRLSLVRQTLEPGNLNSTKLSATSTITEIKSSVFGIHRLVKVEFYGADQEPGAKVEFEIVERKRGLKTADLQALCADAPSQAFGKS